MCRYAYVSQRLLAYQPAAPSSSTPAIVPPMTAYGADDPPEAPDDTSGASATPPTGWGVGDGPVVFVGVGVRVGVLVGVFVGVEVGVGVSVDGMGDTKIMS